MQRLSQRSPKQFVAGVGKSGWSVGYEQAKQDEREKSRAAESQSESWREVGCLFDMQSQKKKIDRPTTFFFFALLYL